MFRAYSMLDEVELSFVLEKTYQTKSTKQGLSSAQSDKAHNK